MPLVQPGSRLVYAQSGVGGGVVAPPGTATDLSGIDPPPIPAGYALFYFNGFDGPLDMVNDVGSIYQGVLGSHTATCYLDKSHLQVDAARSKIVLWGYNDPAVWNGGSTSTYNGVTYTPGNKYITAGISFGNLAPRVPAYCRWQAVIWHDKPAAGTFADIGYVQLEFYGPGAWPDNGELDGFEGTQASSYATNLHWGNPPGTNFALNGTTYTTPDLTVPHLFEVETKPGIGGAGPTITTWVDGVQKQQRTNVGAAFANAGSRLIFQQEAKSLPTSAQLADRSRSGIHVGWVRCLKPA